MARKSRFPRTPIGRWELYWSFVQKTDTCWNWTGRVGRFGYGSFLHSGRTYAAHRLSMFWFNKIDNPRHTGSRSVGVVLHSCDNKRCVNPAHMRVGTAAENTAEAYLRGLQKPTTGDRHSNAKLTSDQVKAIRGYYSSGAYNQYELADKYEVCQRTINKIVNNVSYPESV